VPVKGYCTDVFFDYAFRFIERHRGRERPFFAYIAANAPHSPMHAPPEYAEPYAELPAATAHFLGMIANIDENVGRLRAKLAEWGLANDTLLIFMTDNGADPVGAEVFNAGMRGAKGSAYEGGHRVPFFLHWPAGGFDRGREIPDLTGHVDVAPTLLDLAGVLRPPRWRPDGRSLRPLLEGRSDPDWERRVLIIWDAPPEAIKPKVLKISSARRTLPNDKIA
jgi:arylsulfatase A-like enzyme